MIKHVQKFDEGFVCSRLGDEIDNIIAQYDELNYAVDKIANILKEKELTKIQNWSEDTSKHKNIRFTMFEHKTRKSESNVEMLNQYIEVLENRIVLMEQKFELFEHKLNILNKAKNQTKNDIQNVEKIPTKDQAKSFTGNLCNMYFSTTQKFREHNKKQHPNVITCEKCKKTFDASWKWEIHMKSHNLEKEFSCDQCKKQFNRRSNLKT